MEVFRWRCRDSGAMLRRPGSTRRATRVAQLAADLNVANPENPAVVVAVVGDAWENAGALLPSSAPGYVNLFSSDHYHGNNNGYYLAAAVIYATIYGQSPEGLHQHTTVSSLNLNLSVDPEFLERIAWDTTSGGVGIEFLTHPESRSVMENQPVTFSASVRGSLPHTAQWFVNGEEIPGATGLSHTIENVSSDLDGDAFTVRVSNQVSAPFSDPAILSVTPDTMPPVAAMPSLPDPSTITLSFDEPLSADAASNPPNFTVVYQGRRVSVVSATLSANGASVSLALDSPIGEGFTVGISAGVTDLAGNPLDGGAVVVSRASNGQERKFFIDFGANTGFTGTADDPVHYWNNVGTALGTSDSAALDLLDSDALATPLRLEMVRRFNAANSSGNLDAAEFPVSATRDTLYGNTETWGSQTGVFPAFRISGLDPGLRYSLTFYASRTEITDNRTTLYTVTGADPAVVSLDPSNNIERTASLFGLFPSASGELLVEISPAAQNNNEYHFTYLGALVIAASTNETPVFFSPAMVEGRIVMDWRGAGQLESSPDMREPWTAVEPAPSPPYVEAISGPARFFRLRQGP